MDDTVTDKSRMEITETQPWWRGAVIYQIYPRSYLDTNGDGVGDLPGITEKLDYVASLGVQGIWISPFFTSPMKDFGYDVADYCDVDPVFGTLNQFDALLERAHELGLKVIIDQVYAHTSDQHEWFAQSRASRDNAKSDWYVWKDPNPDGTPPNNWQAVFGGPSWTWDARRQQYYMHNFLPEQPQLNVHNPEVQEALLNVARFWLDRGVDGFRLDAINFSMFDTEFRDNPAWDPEGRVITRPFDLQHHVHNQSHPDIPKFLSRIRSLLDEYGAVFTVAEVGGPDPLSEMRAFTHGEEHLNSAYSFDFLYAPELTPALVKASQGCWMGTTEGEGWPSWAFSNHDAPRCVSRWYQGSDRARFARMTNALLMCLRGNPILYQGEELGLSQGEVPFDALQDPEAIANWPLTLGRDGSRTPMPWNHQSNVAGFSNMQPWLPIGADHGASAVSVQETDAGSVLNFTRKLIRVRTDSVAIRLGDIEFVDVPEPLLLFRRSHGSETVLCLFNLGDKVQPMPAELAASKERLVSCGYEEAAEGLVPIYSALVCRA